MKALRKFLEKCKTEQQERNRELRIQALTERYSIQVCGGSLYITYDGVAIKKMASTSKIADAVQATAQLKNIAREFIKNQSDETIKTF